MNESPEPGTQSAKSRTRLSLPREGAAWLGISFVIGFIGWYKNINLMLLMAYLMMGLVAVNGWLALRQVRRLHARRIPVPPAFAGEMFCIPAEATNTLPRPVNIELLTESPVHQSLWFLPRLRPAETRRAAVDWKVNHRGVVKLSPIIIRSADPFGLIRAARPLGDAAEVVILPRIGQIDLGSLRRWLIRLGAGDAQTRRPVRRPGLHHADVRGVRGYRPGDSRREVHWRTTARIGELMVREYDSTEPLDLILVFDAYQPESGSPARFEQAVSLAASIAWTWAKEGTTAEVSLIVAGETVAERTVTATRFPMRHALAPLASVVPTCRVPDLSVHSLRNRSNRSARIVVSAVPDSPTVARLRHTTGLPYVPVDVTMTPFWYTPPASDREE